MSRSDPRIPRSEVLLFIASVCVVPALVLLAEGALAVVGVEPADRISASIDRLHQYSEVYGWEPRPGRYSDYGGRITITPAGQRGMPPTSGSALVRQRVVILGDSVAFGLYVGDGETYAARLQARRPDLEVANLAVQGYGPGQSLLRLERQGLDPEPDVVVLALCLGNDFADAALPTFLYDETHPKPYFRREQGRLVRYDQHLKLGLHQRLFHWLFERSRLLRATRGRRSEEAARPGASEDRPWTQRRWEAMKDRRGAVDLVARLVEEMRDRSETRGARFLVVLHPDRVAGVRAAEAWEQALVQRLEAAGIESVSLAREYASQGQTYDDLAIDSIGHLNARGHEVTAGVLDQRIEVGAPLQRGAAFTDTQSRRPR